MNTKRILISIGVVVIAILLVMYGMRLNDKNSQLEADNIILQEKIQELKTDRDFLREVNLELEKQNKDLKDQLEAVPEEETMEPETEDTGAVDTEIAATVSDSYVEEAPTYVEPAPVEPAYVAPAEIVSSNSFTASVTMYTLDPAECGKYPGDPGYGITASGVYVSEWYTVAAGPSIPFGTQIYIPYFADKPNGGVFVVQDRGGAIGDYDIDIYVYDKATALNFGRQALEVQILE